MCSTMVVCVLLKRLPLIAALGGTRRELIGEPVALAPEPGREQRVGEVSPAAEAFGIVPGMRVGEALSRCPDLRLVPADPDHRARVEAIEQWVDGDVQQYCRRLVYWALPRHPEAVGSYLEGSKLILPMFLVTPLAPAIIRILRRDHKATDDAVRADLSALPAILDRLDQAVADGVIGGAEPNVADLQVACSLALLMTHDDLRGYIAARPSGKLAERLAAGYPGRMPAAFPAAWLP